MNSPSSVRVLPRSEHGISRRDIDSDALKVLYRLHRNGYQAYLVGGSVRDLLLERRPKDFDISTNATPEQILDLFRNSRIIGRRFPLVHIIFSQRNNLDVSTFRSLQPEEENRAAFPSDQDSLEEETRLEAEADALMDENGVENNERAGAPAALSAATEPAAEEPNTDAEQGAKGKSDRKGQAAGRRNRRRYDRGRHLLEFAGDLQYGNPADDARRRDLTINGLFYNIADFSVIDYVGGLQDLADGVIRSIGDPDLRFSSDPVRMIRALRHAARTGFRIEEKTWNATLRHREKLRDCSKARIIDEFYRDLRGGSSLPCLELMKRSGVLDLLLPEQDRFLPDWTSEGNEEMPLPWRRLEVLDRWVSDGETFTPAFLLAVLISFPLLDFIAAAEDKSPSARPDIGRLAYRFLKPLTTRMGVARRDTELLFLISISQRRLARCREGHPIPRFFANKSYFHEAYQLFQLDSEARGLELPKLNFDERSRRRRRGGRRRKR